MSHRCCCWVLFVLSFQKVHILQGDITKESTAMQIVHHFDGTCGWLVSAPCAYCLLHAVALTLGVPHGIGALLHS